MKRILIVVAVLVLLGAGGWTAMWFIGRGEIEKHIALERTDLAARGWTVTLGDMSIGGFPFGYRVTMTEFAAVSTENGILVRAPALVVAADGDVDGRYVAALPEGLSVDLPLSEFVRRQNQLLPKVVKIAVRGEGLQFSAGGSDSGLDSFGLRAGALAMAIDQPDFDIKIGFAATGVDAVLEPDPQGRQLRFSAARVRAGLEDHSVGEKPTFLTRYDTVTAAMLVSASGLDNFMTGLAERRAGLVEGTFESAGQEIVATILTAVDQPVARVTYRAGEQTGGFGIDEGNLTYRAEERDVAMELVIPPAGARVARLYSGTAEVYERSLRLPVWTGQSEPHEGTLRLSLTGVAADEDVWNAQDPEGVLDRAPGEVQVDITSTLRFGGTGGGGLPVEFSNVSVNDLSLGALGATAKVKGDVEILQPINLPLGALGVRLSGAGGLIDALKAAGLIDDKTHETAAAILEVYARRALDEDRHETVVSFENEGIRINGRALGGLPPQ